MRRRTTTTEAFFGFRRRPRTLGAVVALAITVASCTGGGEDTAAGEPPAGANLTTAAAPGDSPASSPDALLAAALDAYAAGYRFAAVGRVNGEVATEIDGRWSSGSSELSIRAGDGEVVYVITPSGQWVRPAGGGWQELEGDPPLANPLASLAVPASLDEIGGGDEVSLRAVYPAGALGLEGEDVVVDIVLRDGRLVEAGYRRDASGNTLETLTTFSPDDPSPPITSPAASGS